LSQEHSIKSFDVCAKVDSAVRSLSFCFSVTVLRAKRPLSDESGELVLIIRKDS